MTTPRTPDTVQTGHLALVRNCIAAAVAICFSLNPADVIAGDSDFIIFLSAEYDARNGVSDNVYPNSDFTPSVDLLYTYGNGPWRILGEYYLTDDESELERLQLGYDINQNSTAWLGRYHQPLSTWNFKYHHGAFLQSSISRPAIENWEDEDGVIAQHATGAMFESNVRGRNGSGIRYTIAAGIGPTYEDGELYPYDVFDPDDLDGGIATSFAVSFYPDYVDSSNFGMVGGYTDLVVPPSMSLGNIAEFEIRQYLFGAQVDWETRWWQLIAAAYYVDSKPDDGYTQYGGHFVSAYAQLIRELNESFDFYVRLEGGINTRSAGYLSLFPAFITRRALIGSRFDFTARQAIAIEISAVETRQDRFGEISLQWSGVFQ